MTKQARPPFPPATRAKRKTISKTAAKRARVLLDLIEQRKLKPNEALTQLLDLASSLLDEVPLSGEATLAREALIKLSTRYLPDLIRKPRRARKKALSKELFRGRTLWN